MGVPEPGHEIGGGLLPRRELVGGHQLDRGAGEDSPAPVAAPVEQHLQEGAVVVGGGDEAGATGLEDGGPGEAPPGGGVVDGQTAALRIGTVGGGQAIDAGLGDAEPGVAHAEGLEDPLAQEIAERPSRGAGQQHAEQVDAGVVHPHLAGLVSQGQRAEAAQVLVRRDGGLVRRRRHLRLVHGVLDGVLAGVDHHRPQPQAEGQQVAHGDRPGGRHGVRERAVDRAQHAPVGQLRQPAIDGIVQAQRRLLHEQHRPDGGDRLGQGGDAEDGVPAHRGGAAGGEGAGGEGVHLPAAGDQGDQPGHDVPLDVPAQHPLQPVEAFGGEATVAGAAGTTPATGRLRSCVVAHPRCSSLRDTLRATPGAPDAPPPSA